MMETAVAVSVPGYGHRRANVTASYCGWLAALTLRGTDRILVVANSGFPILDVTQEPIASATRLVYV